MTKPKTPKPDAAVKAAPVPTEPEMHAFIATVPASVVNTCGLVNGMTTTAIYERLKAAHVG